MAVAPRAAFPWWPDGSRGTSAFLPPWVTLGEVRLPGSQRASPEYSKVSRSQSTQWHGVRALQQDGPQLALPARQRLTHHVLAPSDQDAWGGPAG